MHKASGIEVSYPILSLPQTCKYVFPTHAYSDLPTVKAIIYIYSCWLYINYMIAYYCKDIHREVKD